MICNKGPTMIELIELAALVFLLYAIATGRLWNLVENVRRAAERILK